MPNVWTWTQVATEIWENFNSNGSTKAIRGYLKQDQKDNLLKKQENKCNICQINLERYEFDHIKALSAGGNNNIENFQVLCIPCHKTKSAKESAERVFKIDNVISTYNKSTTKIFLEKRYGFIHQEDKRSTMKTKDRKTILKPVLGLDI